jgi:hypothetical protein
MPLKNQLVEMIINLGFRKNCIVETILITKNEDGSYNPAPMGVTWVGGPKIEVNPFKSSKTCQNLQRDSYSVINILSDPFLFLATAFKDEIDFDFTLDHYRLEDSEAIIHLDKNECSELSDDRLSFLNEVKDIKIYHKYPRVISRGTSEAINAVIHATRVKYYRRQGKYNEAEYLEKKICDCVELIRRISGEGSPEMKVSDIIEEMLVQWREEL